MFTRLLLLITALSLALPTVANNLQARFWPNAEKARLVIETQAAVEYKILSLNNPPRLVLDVSDKRHDANELNQVSLRDAAYLKKIHTARYTTDTLRFVFTLAESVQYEVRAVEPIGGYQHRLIFDIIPKNHPDPLLALIQSLEATETKTPPFRLVIDPGHGGEDPGAVSPNQHYEKDTVLAIARQLRDEINRRPGMQAFLSRDKDRFLPLAQRVLVAHRLQADAFLSLHADSVKSPKARGSSVFVLSQKGASSTLAKRLAQNANLSDLIGGTTNDPQINAALLAFSKDGKKRASLRLAKAVLKEIGQINTLHKKNVESAGFAVLKSPAIPSILVETAFISNPQEEKKLLSKSFQKQMATAIANGVEKYKTLYHVPDL
ncbi:N-acetylmuramoyl-L-alanine amidase [Candidatus Persebacteraceae bacterium Df01]|jgi:N-acetylmuramoyl-L-alanine amidase|uniref:N-acetylmuramoyl-L-alanine amidase n=1 Tax=Candidatus Doriopsillibacter californiensis TaxID=2970740 RepID=A0ABT7QMT4_9GAMM|nr:N-acetylmuramoyl-L-alanine amidase [Candidatus Persebacteraceae bacterium Df01]